MMNFSMRYILFCALLCCKMMLAQTIVNQPVINAYVAVTAIDFCKNAMSVANNAENNFSIGDKVLIVQMKGSELAFGPNSNNGNINDYGEAGSYEYNEVKSINFGSIDGIQFKNTLLHPYEVNGKIQIIKVPVYNDVEFQATLTGIPWDGSIGGIVVFEATGTVNLQANIFLDFVGFRGGGASNDVDCYTFTGGFQGYSCNSGDNCGGFKGEGLGFAYENQLKGRGRNGNGGGGGNDHNAGGGGGANGGFGGNGSENDLGTQACDGKSGLGGDKNIISTSNNRILMGGAGGAGDSNNNTGTSGANAGAILLIKANAITSNGFTITAKGQAALTAISDGAGGGGAGGTVILDVNTYNDVLTINLNGGKGGNVSDNTNCPAVGGGGAGGSLWVKQGSNPSNINLQVLGGAKGAYTSNLCSSLDNGAQNGEDGGFSLNYVPEVASDLFIPTQLSAGTGAVICVGDETPLTSTLTSSANPNFAWIYNGDEISTLNDLNVAPTSQGLNEYLATARWEVFGQSCIEEEVVAIIVRNPDIVIVVSPTQAVEIGAPVFLNAVLSPINPNYTFLWDPNYVTPNDDRNAVVEPFESTSFCITVTDEIACQKTECVFIPVLLPFNGAPSAFSPNGDNLNEVFRVLPEPQLKQTALKIYNRWGDSLYESMDIFEWDGSAQGKKQAIDTYIWVAEFEHRNTGERSIQDGYVTLIR